LSYDQYLPEAVFQRLDALGDGGRRDGEAPGSRIETAFLEHCGKRSQLGVE
jgi:hypothetical protein